jgi:hypothetical protein
VSSPRRAVGIPLLALLASFAGVLAFGGLFGTSAAAPRQPAPGPAPAPAVVRITIDTELLAAAGVIVEPYPGLRVSLSTAATDRAGPAAVTVCVTAPALGWRVVGAGWTTPNPATRTSSCHPVQQQGGRLLPVELSLARP